MNLHSDYPFWLIKEGVLGHFPSLSRDLSTDVLIIGGGISGALIGHKLVQHDIATTIVTSDTSASVVRRQVRRYCNTRLILHCTSSAR